MQIFWDRDSLLGFQPLDDRVLLEVIPDLPGLIVLTDEKPEGDIDSQAAKLAMVIAVGPGKMSKQGIRKPCTVVPGDVVWYGRFVDYRAGDLELVQEADIVSIKNA